MRGTTSLSSTAEAKSGTSSSGSVPLGSSLTGGGGGGGGGSKKKFGKNLNKLVNRPAAPPIVDRAGYGSSRNGLLLLSKAKPGGGTTAAAATAGTVSSAAAASSTNGSTATVVSSGGLLAKAAASNSTMGAANGSSNSKSTSHHDFLLSTAKGVPATAAESAPDAWGASQNASASAHAAPAVVPTNPPTSIRDDRAVADLHSDRNEHHPESRSAAPPPLVDGPAWDEYGGRGVGPYGGVGGRHRLVDVSAPAAQQGSEDVQASVMSRLAREKAEQKRREEMARVQEQQAKAAMRLKDLELRRVQLQPPNDTTTPPPPLPLPQPRWDATRSGTKELWEPDQQQHATTRRGTNDYRHRSNSSGDRSDNGGPNHSTSPHAGSSNHPSAAVSGPPVIHLSSFDDRDRGESSRAAGSAPRMLFDPKSGSMVAVKKRTDDHHSHPPSNSSSGPATATSGPNSNARKKTTRSGKTRGGGGGIGRDALRGDSPNDVTKIARPSSTLNNAAKSKRDAASGDSTAAKDGPATSKTNRRLPRTCGVLYVRDDKGNCYCADDCEGDLGYGSHSVPGGRTRNPDAYASFLSEHYRRRGANPAGIGSGAMGGEYDDAQLHYDPYGADENYDGGDGDVALYTGFNPEGEFVPPEPIEYVRADDKLELVTGVDDSPSLKPTAKEWAPSQAALAAARAAAESNKDSILESSDDEDDAVRFGNDFDDQDDDEDDDDGPLGLGFDPTIDMDFVMQSPSHDDDRKRVESFAISALDLEPTAFASTDDAVGPRHIFAFGTSGTWGVSNPSSASIGGDWKVSDVNDVNSLFGAGAFRVSSNDDEAKAHSAAVSSSSSVASFLNIPASSSWGSPATPLGGLANVAAPGSAD